MAISEAEGEKEKSPMKGRICGTVIFKSLRMNPDPDLRLSHDPGQRQ